ncbi:MAG: molybdopterin-dependent oxidoreductase [Treponema sp.]|jgi:CO/xanthine dehydrogenase Mo-binding subunit|nr:molybdopterin-dependent oxidoreductase [Treponema sp.]
MDAPGFVEDIYFKPLLYGLTVRSPAPSGRLTAIECPKLSNSYFLITAKDIPGKNQLEDSSVPILASDTLSYIGEPVAILLGPDMIKLEELMKQIRVVAEEDAPVFLSHTVTSGMILAERKISPADEEKPFAGANTIVSGVYTTGIQEHWYSEPTGAAAHFFEEKADKDKTPHESILVINTATQWPFHVRRSIAQLLKIDQSRIRVEPTLIGIHMDGKIWYPSLVACHAALGAWIAKKPVKLILTREEDFRYSPKRSSSEIRISSILDEQGELLSTEINGVIDLGAHGLFTDELLDQTCIGCMGSYSLPRFKLDAAAVKTNIPPQGPFSGYGLAQGVFAIERHISHIADTVRQDPAEWRKNHRLGKNSRLAAGVSLKDAPPTEQLLDTAASMSDYSRKWASYEMLRLHRQKTEWKEKGETLRGIGIALGCQGSGFLYSGIDKGNYSLELTLGKDGSLEIKTSMVSSDDEYKHIWAAIAAEILSIEPGMVKIIPDGSADSGPASASRNITVLTGLVEKCCAAIRKQRFRDPLPITVRKICRPAKGGGSLPNAAGKIPDANCFAHPGWGAAVVEIEIDTIEFFPRVRGAWLGIDGGKILSENRARRSIKTSAVQALGWACREQLVYIDGAIPAESFAEYSIPSPVEIPPIHIDFIWNDTEESKGIGDLPFNCLPAAYLQAVTQAMDHHFQNIPLRPRELWEAAKLRKKESPV